ncbi:hypothetical protein Patl1_19754 [Pistacia atlantica]|uniref:Uncharacterized protein n=1 Tax=Pistacia atlantica TaxID=434234 RepID=A0ACC1BKF7_9ROSI|nr:hypothetical protein Patl1_19754 [Pistacia atlantica]
MWLHRTKKLRHDSSIKHSPRRRRHNILGFVTVRCWCNIRAINMAPKFFSLKKKFKLKSLGPTPNVDVVLSICLQSDIPRGQTGKSGTFPAQTPAGPATSASDVSGSTRSHPGPSGSSFKQTRDKQSLKRKDLDSKFMLPFITCPIQMYETLST